MVVESGSSAMPCRSSCPQPVIAIIKVHGRATQRADLARQLVAAHARHADVEQQASGEALLEALQGLFAVQAKNG